MSHRYSTTPTIAFPITPRSYRNLRLLREHSRSRRPDAQRGRRDGQRGRPGQCDMPWSDRIANDGFDHGPNRTWTGRGARRDRTHHSGRALWQTGRGGENRRVPRLERGNLTYFSGAAVAVDGGLTSQ